MASQGWKAGNKAKATSTTGRVAKTRRQSLSVNHRYGEFEPVLGARLCFLIKCHYRDCFEDAGRPSAFFSGLSGFVNVNRRGPVSTNQGEGLRNRTFHSSLAGWQDGCRRQWDPQLQTATDAFPSTC